MNEPEKRPGNEKVPLEGMDAGETPFAPSGLHVERTYRSLRIVRRWFNRRRFGEMLAACVVTGGISAWLYPGPARQPTQWIPFAIPASCFCFVLYALLFTLMNRTVVTVRRGLVGISHGPLPAYRSVKINSKKIKRLFCERDLQRERSRPRHRRNADGVFLLKARLDDGSDVELVPNLKSLAVCQRLEALMEAYMGLRDRPVPGKGKTSRQGDG